jgi:hypothetical protein
MPTGDPQIRRAQHNKGGQCCVTPANRVSFRNKVVVKRDGVLARRLEGEFQRESHFPGVTGKSLTPLFEDARAGRDGAAR